MIVRELLLKNIKQLVMAQEPEATLILYGSYARGDNTDDSDIVSLLFITQCPLF